MASVENLVIESIQFTNNRTLRKWQIVTAIACIVAIVVTALLIWQVSKDDTQCNVKTHNTVNQNGGKESGTKQEQPTYWRPCPRLPSLIALPETIPEPLSKALSRIGELVNNAVNSTVQLPAISVNVFIRTALFGLDIMEARNTRGKINQTTGPSIELEALPRSSWS